MEKKIKVGIIGLGFMGSTHYHIYKNSPKASVIAIADIDEKKLAGDWSSIVGNIGGFDNSNIDTHSLKTYMDGFELINDPDVELVDIVEVIGVSGGLAVAGRTTPARSGPPRSSLPERSSGDRACPCRFRT